MKYITTYKGKKYVYNITLTHYTDDDYYSLNAWSKDNKEMGFLTYKIMSDGIWVLKLETYEEYQNKGVASALMDLLEYECKKNCKDVIEGKFYPSNQFAKPFYENRGYLIEHETYGQTIFKYIPKNETEATKQKISEYKIIEKCSDFKKKKELCVEK